MDCWGSDYYGEGLDATGPFTQISAGMNNCALRPGGQPHCWGRPFDPGLGRTLSIQAPPRADRGEEITVTGRLWSIDPGCIADMPIQLHGTTPRMANALTDAAGRYSFTVRASGRLRVLVLFRGDSSCPSVESPKAWIEVRR